MRKIPYITLAVLCLASLGFMIHSSLGESATMDELAHIPSGYGYVHELDFRLNPEHPPLVKALAAFPLTFLEPRFPTESPAWQTAINGQWDMGTEFLYKSGNDADQLIQVSRAGPMLLTLLLIIMTWVAARRRMGEYWALLPAFFVAISPHVLAHGHYITTDIGAALGALLAIHFFVKSLEEFSWKNLFVAGLAFGIAQSLKFSMILLLPLFVVLAAVHWSLIRGSLFKYLRNLAFLLIIGYSPVIYPLYAVFTARYPVERQLSDTAAILEPQLRNSCGPEHPLSCMAHATYNLARYSPTRPFAEYSLGLLMVLIRADGGNTSYFLGEVSNLGSASYFPIVYLAKESLPALLFIALALLGTITAILRQLFRPKIFIALKNWLRKDFSGFAMLLFVALYWYTSIRSNLNIGFRHILPTIPFMYILAAGWCKKMCHSPLSILGKRRISGYKIQRFFAISSTKWLRMTTLGILILWAATETGLAAPYFLSYHNELAGGTSEGYRIATDSNYDWGQDLLRLKAWAEKRPEAGEIAVDYFGAGNPTYYLGERAVPWSSSYGNPREKGIHWLAVSVGFLQLSLQPTVPDFYRDPTNEYSWLTALRKSEPGMGGLPKPDVRIGTSLFLYEL